jgi:iron complex outermembrane recepter protein
MTRMHNVRKRLCHRAARLTLLRGLAATTLLVLASLGSCTAAFAGNLDRIFTFNISAQPLDKALLQFGAQAHVQISIPWEPETARLRTRGLRGSYTGREALEMLLKGTPLRYLALQRTVEILPRESANSSASAPAGGAAATARKGAETMGMNGAKGREGDPPQSRSGSQGDSAAPGLQEIVVTAQKYSQRAFDVPISLEVISGSDLRRQGITDLNDLQYAVPGLYMNSTGYTHAVYLRGVGNTYGTGAMVGQYIDDADLTAEQSLGGSGYATGDNGLFDLARVEVLKGPQGTLYGDGSMGGVIRYITNKPVLDSFQMTADVASLFTQYGAPGQRVDTMVNVPVVDGALGLRVAGLFDHDGGWIDEPAADQKNINSGNLTEVRAEARWQPTTAFAVNLLQVVHRHNYGLGTGEDANGDFTPSLQTELIPNGNDNSSLSNITITYELPSVVLLSSSTYGKENQNIYNLFSYDAIGPLTFGVLVPSYKVGYEDYSEEFRVAHSDTGPWQWVVGAFYKHFSDVLSYSTGYFGPEGVPVSAAFPIPGLAVSAGVEDSEAAFANSSYRLDRLTLGAGIRYARDRETYNPPALAGTFTSTDPRFYAEYEATSHVNVYASAAKGFRSGGFNTPPGAPYQPEDLWSYDVGTKTRFPAQGVRSDVDLFYMNYSNFVSSVNVPTPPFFVQSNVGKARIDGVDADLGWQPVEAWNFDLNAEVLRTKFLTASSASGYVAGERLPFAPTYSFTASVDREFVVNGRPLGLQLYYYQISAVQYRTVGAPLSQSDVLRFLSARTDVHWSENLSFVFFADNLLNDRGDESPYRDTGVSTRPRPRTFGVEFDVSFL